ncbi:hypothetical protein VTG60DRAFT_2471 [Thermothelomyces hinnuleus]
MKIARLSPPWEPWEGRLISLLAFRVQGIKECVLSPFLPIEFSSCQTTCLRTQDNCHLDQNHQHLVLTFPLPYPNSSPHNRSRSRAAVDLVVKTFSNLLNSVHHPFAGARCSASSGGAADSIQTE